MKSGLIEEYVLGLSNARDKAQVEMMAENDKEIAQLISDTKNAMESYCRSMRKKTLPTVTARILQRFSSEISGKGKVKKMHPRSKRRVVWDWAGPLAATIAFLALIGVGYLINQNRNLETALAESKSAGDDMMNKMNGLMTNHKKMQSQFAFLQDLNTTHVTLSDINKGTNSMAVIYWNEIRKEAAMRVVNLPEPPRGMTYQLWADVKGEMKDMGIISNNHTSWISLPFIQYAESLNITLEKEGGSSKPTVEKLVSSAQK